MLVTTDLMGNVRDKRQTAIDRLRMFEPPDGYYFFCKGCKKYIVCIGGDADLNYCPNCGAKMEGDKNDVMRGIRRAENAGTSCF